MTIGALGSVNFIPRQLDADYGNRPTRRDGLRRLGSIESDGDRP